ncbi:hypothetical protein GF382_02830 [Candidatus Falkowbacteria bacterium]|nr:hypothetical protein [Candidatus Falkowbacteria bacterium]
MNNVLTINCPRSIVLPLSKSIRCELTGKTINPGENVRIFPRKKAAISYFLGTFIPMFQYQMIVFARPLRTERVYEDSHKAMAIPISHFNGLKIW